MQNEMAMMQCDHGYALTRYCNTPEAPIWMADMSFKPIGEVQVGDEVVGWTRLKIKKHSHMEKLCPSKVIATNRRTTPVVKVYMTSGRVIRCTPDHLWASGEHGRMYGKQWIPAQPGKFLRRVIDVYPSDPPEHLKLTAAWMAGIYDGEGHKTYIAQYRAHNPEVHARIIRHFMELGFNLCVQEEGIQFNGGRSEYARFLAWMRPTRRQSLEKLILRFLCASRDQILFVEPDGESEVIGLQTETGNYTAWGYGSKNCYVKDEENLIGHFNFRTPQKILFDLIAEMEAEGLPIEIMILKARQLGMSTLVELLLMLRVVFGYGVNAVVASAEVEKSGLMARMLFLAYDRLPVWLRPRATARAEESDPKKLVFGSLNTVLSVQHGGKMKGGIAQGWTPTLYHISEVALFPNPEVQIDEGLFRAVHPSASVFGVLESTGAGDAGWWPDTWHYSKSNWATRSCRLRPLFLPWFCGVEIYPKPDWVHAHPVPANFYERRLPDTRSHVAKAEAYVASRPEIQRYLGSRWTMPLAQQWFWEVGFEEAKSKGRESLWYQAMAGDDIEALQRSAESIFGHDTIIEVDERRKRGYTMYGLTGQSIEANHEPDTSEIDYAKPRIPVRYASNKGEVYRWELIPLLHDEHQLDVWQRTNTEAFKEYANGKLVVFHPPLAGVDYSVGIDTSNGIGSDSTVISVTAVGQRGGPDTQVAEFRSQYVSHVEAYAFAMVTCAYYASLMTDVGHREPLVAAEQLRSVGDTCQLQMRKMGYSRFHRFIRYDKMRIDKGSSNQLGWMTTGWSRPLLIGGFIHSLTNGWYILNSPWTLHECAHFEQHLTATGRPKPEHADGECDDGIFAAAISTFIAHDVQSMTERTKRKFMGDPISKPLLDLKPYMGQSFSTVVKPPVDIDHLL